MGRGIERPIRVMRIIARMNVGGPAVQVSGLMRGFNSVEFDHRLYTGFCAVDEADYLDSIATDVKAIRIEGLGRRVSFGGDIKAFVSLVKAIRDFKPHIIPHQDKIRIPQYYIEYLHPQTRETRVWQLPPNPSWDIFPR